MQPAGGRSTKNKRAQIMKFKLVGESEQKDVKQMGKKQWFSVLFIYLLVFFPSSCGAAAQHEPWPSHS